MLPAQLTLPLSPTKQADCYMLKAEQVICFCSQLGVLVLPCPTVLKQEKYGCVALPDIGPHLPVPAPTASEVRTSAKTYCKHTCKDILQAHLQRPFASTPAKTYCKHTCKDLLQAHMRW
jgi:hypothetical protein